MGEPMVEFVREPGPGPKRYLRGFGGDVSNAAIAAARQGAEVAFFTALGNDEFGRDILDLWADEGVDASAVLLREDASTAIYFVDPHAEERRFTYFRAGSAASRVTAADVPEAAVRAAAVLHLSAISQAIGTGPAEAGFHAMRIARAAGTLVSYDTNLRLKLWSLDTARATTEAALRLADIALPSLDDARILTGLDDADAIVDAHLALGPGIVVLKCGADGAVIAAGGERRRIPAAPARPVDSTGAGDAFGGAFLARFIETGDPFAAGHYAAAVAAATVSGFGAVEPIPRRAEVEAMLGAAPTELDAAAPT
ncbi:sugar kinase [Methylobrevis sp. L22]|uniref:Sugar kinase n=2 Tax=Methylobrevis albus TaxID=2793297 RepID=A0A931I2H9_9HYPH|nr:sugar kinase [Methylobrevis albus]